LLARHRYDRLPMQLCVLLGRRFSGVRTHPVEISAGFALADQAEEDRAMAREPTLKSALLNTTLIPKFDCNPLLDPVEIH